MPECRNWQTNRTQNPAHFTGRVGSSPTSGTSPSLVRASLGWQAKACPTYALRGGDFETQGQFKRSSIAFCWNDFEMLLF